MTDDWDPRQCLYGDDDAKAFVHLGILVVLTIVGACLGCALYGLIAWIAVCP